MLYYFYGKNSFLIEHSIKSLLKELQIENCYVYDSEKLTLPCIHECTTQQGLFGGRSAILFKDATEKTPETIISEYLYGPLKESESSVVIFRDLIPEESKAVGPTSSFGRALAKHAIVTICNYYDVPKLIDWIDAEVHGRGCTIVSDATNLLLEYVGFDMYALRNEIAKLSAYVLARGSNSITKNDIVSLVNPRFDEAIFSLLDAISNKNSARAQHLLERHYNGEVSEYYINTMLVYQMRIMLQVYAANIKNKTTLPGIHPYAFKKAKTQMQSFSFQHARSIYTSLLQLDKVLKSKPRELHRSFLSLFVASMARK